LTILILNQDSSSFIFQDVDVLEQKEYFTHMLTAQTSHSVVKNLIQNISVLNPIFLSLKEIKENE